MDNNQEEKIITRRLGENIQYRECDYRILLKHYHHNKTKYYDSNFKGHRLHH